MRKLSVFVAIVFLAQPLYAANGVDMVALSAAGEGNWEMICHATLAGGDQVARVLDNSRSSYSTAGLRRLSCDLKAPAKSPLVVHLSVPASSCPFKDAAEGACEKTFSKGTAGSFEVKIKATP